MLVTLAFLMFFGYELSLNVVAAILTIIGYSVNDTIVIFDRVRENMRSMRKDSLETVVNISVNQTLADDHHRRHDVPVGAGAVLFGGEALEGFAFTMLVGIISGTYSTVFIASAIAIILSQTRQDVARRLRRRRPAEGRAQAEAPRRSVSVRFPLFFCGARSWDRAGPHGVPADLVDGAPAAGGAGFRLQDPGGVFTVMIQLGRCWR